MSEDWSEEYYKEPTKLELKQRERREFVKAYTTELARHENCSHRAAIMNGISCWSELDKQLSELEKKESEGE
jgi:hypothetical protein